MILYKIDHLFRTTLEKKYLIVEKKVFICEKSLKKFVYFQAVNVSYLRIDDLIIDIVWINVPDITTAF